MFSSIKQTASLRDSKTVESQTGDTRLTANPTSISLYPHSILLISTALQITYTNVLFIYPGSISRKKRCCERTCLCYPFQITLQVFFHLLLFSQLDEITACLRFLALLGKLTASSTNIRIHSCCGNKIMKHGYGKFWDMCKRAAMLWACSVKNGYKLQNVSYNCYYIVRKHFKIANEMSRT